MFAKTFVALAAVSSVLAQGITLNTPTGIAQCIPQLITWTGGTPPYTLAANSGSNTAVVVEYVAFNLTGTEYSWAPVNLPAGLSISLRLIDAGGNSGQTAVVTIQQGTTSSCLNATAVTSGVPTGAVSNTVSGSGTQSGTTAASTTGAASGSASGAAMSGSAASRSPASSTGSGTGTGSASPATSSSATPSPSSAASAQYIAGVPALIGAAAVALAALF